MEKNLLDQIQETTAAEQREWEELQAQAALDEYWSDAFFDDDREETLIKNRSASVKTLQGDPVYY